jgi:hypothetical protein
MTKGWDAQIGDRAVLTWVRCGRSRLLAVVAGDPPRVLAYSGPADDFRHLRVFWDVGCRTHGDHKVNLDLVVSATERGLRNVDVSSVEDPT